jgi:hypothetical protein
MQEQIFHEQPSRLAALFSDPHYLSSLLREFGRIFGYAENRALRDSAPSRSGPGCAVAAWPPSVAPHPFNPLRSEHPGKPGWAGSPQCIEASSFAKAKLQNPEPPHDKYAIFRC